ncbi:hypothetical protein PF005_g25650 [Phytophthora fragariae]|uniref:Uncharacterized protein n=1 Tax=Phytophthora fragariae TaxID=53985 RepID=A0A6A3SS93_9STRA|nr:hypothetical protein PF007_g7303 [Phytophthora fragariae]KAE9174898.1 hypothetical protein PF005_g25650 [Phytophthora fragariae]
MTMSEELQRYGKSFVRIWEELQIESNGAYSVERLQQLRDYSERVTAMHCVIVLVVTPLPCLLVIVLIESIPLRPPADGIEHSFLLWVRTFALTVVVVLGCMWPCRVVVPGLPLSITPVIVAATASAIAGAAGAFGIAYAIGFPLPFTLVCESGIGMFIMGMGMVAAWGRFLASDRVGRRALIRHFILEFMQATMMWVYPAYAYVFNQLSGGRQIATMALLPVIKTLYKNAFARMLHERQDLQPILVVFSAELFHVLFLSYCMNDSTSKEAIVSLMFVDVLEAGIAVHAVNKAAVRITSPVLGEPRILSLMRRVKYLKPHSTFSSALRNDSLLDRTKFAMGLPNSYSTSYRELSKFAVVESQPRPRIDVGVTAICSQHVKKSRIMPFEVDPVDDQPSQPLHAMNVRSTATVNAHRLSSCSSLVDLAVAAQQFLLASDPSADTAIFHEFVHHSVRLLYTTEFVLLVEFTEVMIPCIYSMLSCDFLQWFGPQLTKLTGYRVCQVFIC